MVAFLRLWMVIGLCSMAGCGFARKRAGEWNTPSPGEARDLPQSEALPKEWPERAYSGTAKPLSEVVLHGSTDRIKYSASGGTMADFCRFLALEYGIAVTLEIGLENQPVVGEFDGTIPEVLSVQSRRMGCGLIRMGDRQYLIGKLTEGDKAMMVRSLRSLSPKDGQDLLSKVGTLVVNVSPDGVVVALGDMGTLRQLGMVLDALESRQVVSYVVQVQVLEVRDELLRDLGVDAVPLVEVAATSLLESSPQAVTHGLTGSAKLAASLRAAASDKRAAVVLDPLICCVAGVPGTHADQTQVPVTSAIRDGQTGQVDSSTQFIPVGLKLTVEVVPIRDKLARVAITLQDGSQAGESAGRPVVSKREYTTTADIPCGETFVVGSIRKRSQSASKGKWFQWGSKQQREDVRWVLTAHVVQVTA